MALKNIIITGSIGTYPTLSYGQKEYISSTTDVCVVERRSSYTNKFLMMSIKSHDKRNKRTTHSCKTSISQLQIDYDKEYHQTSLTERLISGSK